MECGICSPLASRQSCEPQVSNFPQNLAALTLIPTSSPRMLLRSSETPNVSFRLWSDYWFKRRTVHSAVQFSAEMSGCRRKSFVSFRVMFHEVWTMFASWKKNNNNNTESELGQRGRRNRQSAQNMSLCFSPGRALYLHIHYLLVALRVARQQVVTERAERQQTKPNWQRCVRFREKR